MGILPTQKVDKQTVNALAFISRGQSPRSYVTNKSKLGLLGGSERALFVSSELSWYVTG